MISSAFALADLLLLPAPPVHPARQRTGFLVHVAADEEVVEHRHPAEQGDVLEGARDSQPRPRRRTHADDVVAVEDDATLLRPVYAADAIEQAGLAGAVRSDDGVQGAVGDRKADVGKSGDAAEAQQETRDVQEGGRHPT